MLDIYAFFKARVLGFDLQLTIPMTWRVLEKSVKLQPDKSG
jgi:hypothetical protein